MTCFKTLDLHFPLLSPSCSVLGFPLVSHTFPLGCFLALVPLSRVWRGGSCHLGVSRVAILVTGFGNGLFNWCNFAE